MLRTLLSDDQKVGWPEDDELGVYLDRAADYYSEYLITAKDPTMMKILVMNGLTPLPDDFVSFAGNVPVTIIGRECEGLGEVLYWGRFPYACNNKSHYTRQQALMIIDLARIFALNKNEYDVSQDLTLAIQRG
jgi:hypothetical protein